MGLKYGAGTSPLCELSFSLPMPVKSSGNLTKRMLKSPQGWDVANIIMIQDVNADPSASAGGVLNLFCNTNNFEQFMLLESQQG